MKKKIKTTTIATLHIGIYWLYPNIVLDGQPPEIFYLAIPQRLSICPGKDPINPRFPQLSFYKVSIDMVETTKKTSTIHCTYHCQGDAP